MSNKDFAFNFINLNSPERELPRKTGLTMMIDWGLPLRMQQDLIENQGLYFDEAKIAASISGLIPLENLKRKIRMYIDAGKFCFLGGLFAEVAIVQNKYEQFLEETKKLGFSGMELSDNLINLSPKKKHELIKKAHKDMGMVVMGEVGGKDGHMEVNAIIDDVLNCLDAGAHTVLIEAHELFHGTIRTQDVELLFTKVPAERIMIELPVTVLPDSTKSKKIEILFWLIRRFGVNVNIANVEWDEVYFTEMSRRGACGDASDKYDYKEE